MYPQDANFFWSLTMIPPFRILLSALVASFLLTGTNLIPDTAAAGASSPEIHELDFTVLRDGKNVGRHVMTFSNIDEGFGVEIKTDVVVKFAFIPVYHFNHKSRERWRDDRLVMLESSTDDDGTTHSLTVKADSASLHVVGDGEASIADPAIIPASLWRKELAKAGDATILNTLDGHKMAVNVAFAGDESLMAGGVSVNTRHFVVTGDLQRELWYDPAGTLVKVRFKGSDGSDIQYVLQ